MPRSGQRTTIEAIHEAIAASEPGTYGAVEKLLQSARDLYLTRATPTEIERDRLRALLRVHGSNVTKAARAIGVTRRTLYLWMRRLGLRRATAVPCRPRGGVRPRRRKRVPSLRTED